jgi:ER lumen protein retaining receptor
MKIIFISTSLAIIYYMRYHKVVRQTYDKTEDTFRSLFLVVPAFVLALFINQERSVIEVCRQSCSRGPR